MIESCRRTMHSFAHIKDTKDRLQIIDAALRIVDEVLPDRKSEKLDCHCGDNSYDVDELISKLLIEKVHLLVQQHVAENYAPPAKQRRSGKTGQ